MKVLEVLRITFVLYLNDMEHKRTLNMKLNRQYSDSVELNERHTFILSNPRVNHFEFEVFGFVLSFVMTNQNHH